jgi:hypothetical protein
MAITKTVVRRLPRAAAIVVAAVFGGGFGHALESASAPDAAALISQALIGDLRAILDNPLVHRSIALQNARYEALSQAEVDRLDAQWREEREADDKPLLAITLSNPQSGTVICGGPYCARVDFGFDAICRDAVICPACSRDVSCRWS